MFERLNPNVRDDVRPGSAAVQRRRQRDGGVAPLLALQQAAGNHAVARLLAPGAAAARAPGRTLARALNDQDGQRFREHVCDLFKADSIGAVPRRYRECVSSITKAAVDLEDAKARFEVERQRVAALEAELRRALADKLSLAEGAKLPPNYETALDQALAKARSVPEALALALASANAPPRFGSSPLVGAPKATQPITAWFEGKPAVEVVKPCVPMWHEDRAEATDPQFVLWSGGAGACLILAGWNGRTAYVKHATPDDVIAETKSLAKDVERELGPGAKLYLASQIVASNATYLDAMKAALGNELQCFASTSLAINAKTGAVAVDIDRTGLPRKTTVF
ncbi:hypothetical protein DVA67_030685 [Solirubrobacter sp. CPCC 204708]|uniref:Uncharacterized protein n=1 Tax=Solirubrobacter deserti TaxID=2282478 RepID=A0ABT4RT03_9ACTN|nr:hypothetical protein [Solirubrobacter deserti]MBE2320371.1 hypothetical protein [Solirubrobacter deserti]MDA0141723.1 hypothetical protein [Solirubrobacter deserti]